MMKNFNVVGDMFTSTREMITKPPKIKVNTLLDNRFIVLRKLCEGSSCSVYLAMDEVTGLEVALKIVNINCASAVGRLIHEKRVFDVIDDSSLIVKCHGLHQAEVGHIPVMFLVKENAPSGSLMDWLAKYTDDHEHRLNYGLDVFKACARAVALIHRQGIVCNDLSLSNFVKVGNTWKICDLGLANYSAKNILCEVGPDVWGTPAIMSPEAFDVVSFAELSFQSDIYGMAILLHQLLSPNAYPPFFAKSYERIRQLHYNHRPPKLDCVEEYLTQIVIIGLKKDPTERHSSIEQMIDDIDNKKPEVITSNLGNENYLAGKVKYDNGEYCEAEVELKKIPPEHDNYGYAETLLEDIESRYQQVATMVQSMSQGVYSNDLSGAKKYFKKCNSIYPDHPLLRPIKADLDVKSEKINDLFELFNSSLMRNDIKNIELILYKMIATDEFAVKTHFARGVLNEFAKCLDDVEDQLSIAELCHDFDQSLEIQAKFGNMITGITVKDSVKKLPPEQIC